MENKVTEITESGKLTLAKLTVQVIQLANLVMENPTLPTSYRTALRNKVKEGTKIEAIMEESLGLLSMLLKYNNFDLEASKRENVYLRNMLENPGGETGI